MLFPNQKTVSVVTLWKAGSPNDTTMGEMLEKYGYAGTFYGSDSLPSEVTEALISLGHDFSFEEPLPSPHADLFRLRCDEEFSRFLEVWTEIEEKDGSVLLLHGDPSELPPDPKLWLDLECILGYLGGISHVWYGSVLQLNALFSETIEGKDR